MNFLSRIPFWAWYLFSVVYCYAIWNPSYSLWQFLGGDYPASTKALAAVVVGLVASFYAVEGHKTWNAFGLAIFVALIGTAFWFAFDNGFHAFRGIDYWGQWVVGLFMTLAVQGGRLYRSLTGRVPVSPDSGDHHVGGHHG